MSKILSNLILFLFCAYFLCGDQRRIGKRHDLSWTSYYQLGINSGSYSSSEEYPDLSIVGALISNDGALGTATLVAPDYIVTAAHVVKNDYYTTPEPNDWKFYLHHDFGEARNSYNSYVYQYQIEEIKVHPVWTARQTASNTLGDGDELGVDLAIAKLNRAVIGVYPARLPSGNDDPLGLRAVLGGFGTLVDGSTGSEDSSNDQRVGGENTIDRSVAQVTKWGVPLDQQGGVLGIDFDSPQSGHNVLASGNSVELLGSGNSQAAPLSLEASTAVGDSGGPAFVRTNGAWRVHGVVSYGTSDSTYGDVTVYTRLASHYDWLMSNLPDWPDSKILDNTGWLENPWLGTLVAFNHGWNYHINLGWLFVPSPKGNSFWAWSDLINKWIWLSDQAFPFVYCYSGSLNSWLYILLESANGSVLRAYDYSTSSWVSYQGG